MAAFTRFEDILAWQRARELSRFTYRITSQAGFRYDFTLKDQMRRAANSVALNIAEGFARQTDKEFQRFLFIAHGSLAEVQTALYLAKDHGVIDKQAFRTGYDLAEEISRMIMGLIKYLRTNLT